MNDDFASAPEFIAKTILRDTIGPSWIKGTMEPNLEECLDLSDSDPTRKYLGGFLEPAGKPLTNINDVPETLEKHYVFTSVLEVPLPFFVTEILAEMRCFNDST